VAVDAGAIDADDLRSVRSVAALVENLTV
jgi:hypothetical protein